MSYLKSSFVAKVDKQEIICVMLEGNVIGNSTAELGSSLKKKLHFSIQEELCIMASLSCWTNVIPIVRSSCGTCSWHRPDCNQKAFDETIINNVSSKVVEVSSSRRGVTSNFKS